MESSAGKYAHIPLESLPFESSEDSLSSENCAAERFFWTKIEQNRFEEVQMKLTNTFQAGSSPDGRRISAVIKRPSQGRRHRAEPAYFFKIAKAPNARNTFSSLHDLARSLLNENR
jgi:hypothetical protein